MPQSEPASERFCRDLAPYRRSNSYAETCNSTSLTLFRIDAAAANDAFDVGILLVAKRPISTRSTKKFSFQLGAGPWFLSDSVRGRQHAIHLLRRVAE